MSVNRHDELSQQVLVAIALAQKIGKPATANDLAALTKGKDFNSRRSQIWARLSFLRKKGLIESTTVQNRVVKGITFTMGVDQKIPWGEFRSIGYWRITNKVVDDRVMTASEIAVELGISYRTVNSWAAKKVIPIVGKVVAGEHNNTAAHLYRFGDARTVSLARAHCGKIRPPDGYVAYPEAMILTGYCRDKIRKLVKDGEIQCVRMPFSHKDTIPFFSKESIDNHIANRKEMTRENGEKHYDRPLICADHAVCLDARRKLFEKMLSEGRRKAG